MLLNITIRGVVESVRHDAEIMVVIYDNENYYANRVKAPELVFGTQRVLGHFADNETAQREADTYCDDLKKKFANEIKAFFTRELSGLKKAQP